jgi:hypothetical protein
MDTKHTPGPWFHLEGRIWAASEDRKSISYLVAHVLPNGGIYYSLDDEDMNHEEIMQARDQNARLIAAAPDMLKALELTRTYFSEFEPGAALRVIESAITKATGA